MTEIKIRIDPKTQDAEELLANIVEILNKPGVQEINIKKS